MKWQRGGGDIPLTYGERTRAVPLPEPTAGCWAVAEPQSPPPLSDWQQRVRELLAAPIGTPPLAELARRATAVGIIVGDQYRDGPRMELIGLLRKALSHLPEEAFTIFIANGTHAAFAPEASGLRPDELGAMEIVNHDAKAEEELEFIGVTKRGVPVLMNRRFLECDLTISLGQVKPHYFAGLAGGAKGVFPGLAGQRSIAVNHHMKLERSAHFGVLDGNPVREDFEEVADMVGHDFIIDVVLDADKRVADVTAGHFRLAHRALCERNLHCWQVPVERAEVVVMADGLPITRNLYQACKLLAAGALCVKPGGTLVLIAECAEGTGPIRAVNHRIFHDGIRPLLPKNTRILVASEIPDAALAETSFAQPVHDLSRLFCDELPRQYGPDARYLYLPKAGGMIPVSPDAPST